MIYKNKQHSKKLHPVIQGEGDFTLGLSSVLVVPSLVNKQPSLASKGLNSIVIQSCEGKNNKKKQKIWKIRSISHSEPTRHFEVWAEHFTDKLKPC